MGTETNFYTKQLRNILVIEDLPSWQKKFERFLKAEPFRIVFAADWLAALDFARVYTFDLVILDINLSGVPYNIDGLRVANELWCGNKDLAIIIVSGDRDWYRRLETFDFAPRFIFEKQTLDQDDFVKKIHQALDY